ncbi:MAG: hypothetical protein J6H20_07340 [Pyramidobacter sp.]|nr:hypothetical protein [Pyramidobacter sp.]MBP3752421.1 hypothetical protein [Pyramidobacter sp.]MBQ9422716.1 hypothetical protein [Pyramidobacter sp.]
MFRSFLFSYKQSDGYEFEVSVHVDGKKLLHSVTRRVDRTVPIEQVALDKPLTYAKRRLEAFEALKVEEWPLSLTGEPEDEYKSVQWKLETVDELGNKRVVRGKDAYPENWRAFVRYLDELVPKLRILDPDGIDEISINVDFRPWRRPDGPRSAQEVEETLVIRRWPGQLSVSKKWGDMLDSFAVYDKKGGFDELIDLFEECMDDYTAEPPEKHPDLPVCKLIARYHGGDGVLLKFPYTRVFLPERWTEAMDKLDEFLKIFASSCYCSDQSRYYFGMRKGERLVALVLPGLGLNNSEPVWCWTDDDGYYPGNCVRYRDANSRNEKNGLVIKVEYAGWNDIDLKHTGRLLRRLTPEELDKLEIGDKRFIRES